MQFSPSRISKFSTLWLAAVALLAPLAPNSSAAPAVGAPVGDPRAMAAQLNNISSILVPFVANQGQLDERVSFYAKTFAGTVFVTRDGKLVYSLGAKPGHAGASGVAAWALAESLTAESTRPVGFKPSVTRVSRFKAGTGAGYDLPTFDEVRLGEIAPGISARVRATGTNVEKLFTVEPGADAARIHATIDGAERLALKDDGSLAVATGLGEVRFTAPVAWQERDGTRIDVPVRYVLAGDSGYGFALGAHDPTLALVIDPLIRSTFAGGGNADAIRAIAIHPGTGDIYVAGYSSSTDFPKTTSGAQPTNPSGTSEAIVAHYTPGLTSLFRASYYGGSGVELATAIAIHPSTGDVYIAGTTSSATGLLNISGTYAGGNDAFIARFDGALATVLSARYYGGSGNETISGLAVDTVSGDIVVVGETTSTNLPLGTPGSAQLANGGGQDGFAARFSANLTALLRATYFGGAGLDRALAVAIDPITGDVILGGSTTSPTLLGVANGALPTNGGGASDGFVARLDGGLTTVRMSSFFGGSDLDTINAVAIHPTSGDIYVAGDTRSLVLRGKPGAQRALGGGSDAFVGRFHSDLTGLQAVTYFGNLGDDFANAIAISKYSGEVYIAGRSDSTTLPGTSLGIQEGNAGGFDAYIARFDAALDGIRQATFIGGPSTDIANAVALTETTAYIAGETSSAAFPAAAGSAQAALAGASDGFISQMGVDLRLGNSNPAPFSFVPITNALPGMLQVSAPTKVTPSGDSIAYIDGQPGSSWCASTAANCSCDKTGSVYVTGAALLTGLTPYYVCVRHTASAAPDAVTESRLHIGGIAGIFRVATGGGAGLLGCTLDVDGNGVQDALTDGLLIIRALFGLTGTAVTTGTIGSNATRTTWAEIRAYLNSNCGSTIP